MASALRWGPLQKTAAERAWAFAERHVADAPALSPGVLRAAASDAGLSAMDVQTEPGAPTAGLMEAMAVAEAMGERLPRAMTSALLEPLPARVLSVMERGRALLPQIRAGQAAVALLDATGAQARLERRPGGTARLTGDLPGAVVPADARIWAFVVEERADWWCVALVAAHHAALRTTPVEGLPLMWASGVLDVEIAAGDTAMDASLEVSRALAAEEVIRAARAVGEAYGAMGGDDVPDALACARTGLYAAAERLLDAGPYTLLGEEVRFGPLAGALEARALARTAWRAARDALAAKGHPAAAHVRMDLAGASAHDVTRSPLFRLGDGRQGAVASARARPGSTRPEARTPLPADSSTPRAVGEKRTTTGRMLAAATEWGSLSFVPPPLRRLQLEARQFVVEHFEPGATALAREGQAPRAVWEALAGRQLLGTAVPTTAGGLGLGLAGLAVVMEEAGRTHPVLATSIMGNTLASWWLGARDGPRDVVETLLQGKVWAAPMAGHGEALGRPDASVVWLAAPGRVMFYAVTPRTAIERDVPARFAVEAGRVLADVDDARAAADFAAASDVAVAARTAGWCAGLLEAWRASLHGRPEASRLAQAERLGEGWAGLAVLRAELWMAVSRLDEAGQGPPLAHRARRCARALATTLSQVAFDGGGLDADRPGARLRELLRHGRTWQTTEG